MATLAKLVCCDKCGHNSFKVLVVGTGEHLVDHVLVCDDCAFVTNILNGLRLVVNVEAAF